MANPTPTADTNVLIKTAAQKLAQIDSIDQQSKQHQASLEAWAKQRAALAAEAEQITAAIKNGTEWPPAAANNPA